MGGATREGPEAVPGGCVCESDSDDVARRLPALEISVAKIIDILRAEISTSNDSETRLLNKIRDLSSLVVAKKRTSQENEHHQRDTGPTTHQDQPSLTNDVKESPESAVANPSKTQKEAKDTNPPPAESPNIPTLDPDDDSWRLVADKPPSIPRSVVFVGTFDPT